MKTTILIILLALINTFAQGQSEKKRFSYAATIGTGIAVSTPSTTPFTFQAQGFYHITSRFMAGGGSGISIYDNMALIPIYGSLRINLTRPHKITPYLECSSGYSFIPKNSASGGFYLYPSAGMQFAITEKLKMQIALGYEQQALKRLKSHTDEYFRYEFCEELKHHTIMLKAGIVF